MILYFISVISVTWDKLADDAQLMSVADHLNIQAVDAAKAKGLSNDCVSLYTTLVMAANLIAYMKQIWEWIEGWQEVV